ELRRLGRSARQQRRRRNDRRGGRVVMTSLSRLAAVVLVATAVAGCTTKKVEPPAPSGPSELSTSLTLSASPDVLTQDGQSTSQIVIVARDANAQPIRGLSLRADIMV